MNIRIKDFQELLALKEQYMLKPLSMIQSVIGIILTAHYHKGAYVTNVYVRLDLLPESYRAAAAMFGKTIVTEYPVLQTFLKGEYMQIRGSYAARPRSFKRRAIVAMRSKTKFYAKKRDIPASYQKRPELLAYQLSSELGQAIAIVAKKRGITWKYA